MTSQTKGASHQISNSVYRLLLESSMAGYWDWHIPSNQEYLSPRFKSMFGFEDHELPNAPESWQKLIFQEDLPQMLDDFDAHVSSKGKIPFSTTLRYRHKNGSTVHVECNGLVIEWGEDGSPIRAVGTHVDITKQVQNKQELQLKNELHELILKGSHAGIWDWDIIESNEWWSPRFYALLGFDNLEHPPSHDFWINQIVHPLDREKVDKAIDAHIEDNVPYRLDIRMRHKSKGFRWFETTGQATWNEHGVPTRMSGSIIDIQDRILANEKVEHQAFLLEEMGKMAKTGAWEVNLITKDLSWSDEVYRIHELPKDQPPSLIDAINFYIEEDRTTISKLIDDAIASNKDWDEECQIRTTQGNIKWVRSIGKTIRNSENKTVGLKGVFQDITGNKQREFDLLESLKTVDEQNKRLMNFAHIVSHNLRSHTGNIEMILNLLNDQQSAEETELYLSNLGKVSKNLSETISHLNEIVSIQTESSLKKEVLHFERILNITKETLYSEIQSEDVIFTFDFDECPVIEYVSAYINSIVLNLVSNAIKYRSMDRACEIKLCSRIHHGKTQLIVEDNGLGIDLELHGEKLFGMYKTFHKNPNSRGIGLFITRNQIESQGGHIEVSSRVDKGTRFTITF